MSIVTNKSNAIIMKAKKEGTIKIIPNCHIPSTPMLCKPRSKANIAKTNPITLNTTDFFIYLHSPKQTYSTTNFAAYHFLYLPQYFFVYDDKDTKKDFLSSPQKTNTK